MKSVITLATCLAVTISLPTLAQSADQARQPQLLAALETAQTTPAPRRQVMRQATEQRVSRATPRARRVYEDRHTSLSMSLDPRYECEHNAQGEAISCWCNWNEDANDCKNMILNSPCGEDGAWWTSDVPGEYGCDTQ